jgi:hypothetical protein
LQQLVRLPAVEEVAAVVVADTAGVVAAEGAEAEDMAAVAGVPPMQREAVPSAVTAEAASATVAEVSAAMVGVASR